MPTGWRSSHTMPTSSADSSQPDPGDHHVPAIQSAEDGEIVDRDDQMLLFSEQRYMSGPLPAPAVLAAYREFDEGLYAKIIGWADDNHTVALEHARADVALTESIVAAGLRSETRAQWLGFAIAVAGFVAATAMVLGGYPWAGAAIGVLDITGLVGVFMYGSVLRRSASGDFGEAPDGVDSEAHD